MALIYLSGAWVAGIFLGAKLDLPPALIAIGLLPLPLLLFFRQRRKQIILASVCLIAFLGGALCYQASLPPEDGSHISSYREEKALEVSIEGMVITDPEVRDNCTHLRLSVSRIEAGEEWREVSGDILLFAHHYPQYQYGDVLRVRGELETPAQLDDFDYQGYLENQGIYATMLYPETELRDSGQGSPPLEWIYSLRNNLAESIGRAIPEPQASLVQGVLLGIRYNIPDDVEADFVLSGTAHLLAISGIHLSIIAGIMLSLGTGLFGRRRFIYIWLALGVIWLYALLSGLHPPIIRGAIMASLFLGAELLGRQRTAATSLAFAAAVMVAVDPPILWGAAFQLSFLAMAGLIFINPPLRALGRRAVRAMLGDKGAVASLVNFIADGFSVTLAATIAVWPLIAYYFGVVSLVGLPATLLALPALPPIIVTGAAAGLAGLFLVPLAQGIGWLSWFFASYLLLVVSGLASLPLSSVEVGSVSPAFIIVYYLALFAAVGLISRREWRDSARGWLKSAMTGVSRLPWKWVIPPLLVLAALSSVAAASMPDDELTVSFLDIGQGDAILIQQGSQQVLVDGGPSPQLLAQELGERMPFWDRTIELVVLTHPDDDHISGLVEVLKRYRVEQVLYADFRVLDDFTDPLFLYGEWEALIAEKDIPYTLAQAGQEIDLGNGVTMEVLNPPASLMMDTESDSNNNSLVLRLSLGQVSFLLTGDIMWEAEFALLGGGELASTVLKVAHHGSATSTTPDFLEAASPRVAVISAGADNRFGHPTTEVLERLEDYLENAGNIFRTDQQGTIEFATDGESLWVTVERE